MTEDEARALIRERLAEKMSGKPFNPARTRRPPVTKSTDYVTFVGYGGQSLTVLIDDVVGIYGDDGNAPCSYLSTARLGVQRLAGTSDDNRVRFFVALTTREDPALTKDPPCSKN